MFNGAHNHRLPRAAYWKWHRRGAVPISVRKAFEDETWTERYREFRFWLWSFFAFDWAMLVPTAMHMPEQLGSYILLRLCVVTPMRLVAVRLLFRRQPLWLESLACVLPYVFDIVSVEVLFVTATVPDVQRAVIVLTVDVMAKTFLIPLRSRQVIVYAAAALLFGDAVIVGSILSTHTHVDPPDIIFGHALVLLSIIGRTKAEARARGAFVKGMNARRRTIELARSNEQLAELSRVDPLTGIANRRTYDKELGRLGRSAATAGNDLAILMIDVDRFKALNDSLGHQRGDECLVLIARTIAGQIRDGQDILARFGGEEFVVLMPDISLAMAIEVAERVRVAVAALAVVHPGGIETGFVTVSVGAATLTQLPRRVVSEVVAAADAALYAAKTGGRNRVCWHGAAANEGAAVPMATLSR